jgi:hypothetical protein
MGQLGTVDPVGTTMISAKIDHVMAEIELIN